MTDHPFLTDDNIDIFVQAILKKRWLPSTYLDNGQWGILTEGNEIVVGLSSRLTEALARHIAEVHNMGLAGDAGGAGDALGRTESDV